MATNTSQALEPESSPLSSPVSAIYNLPERPENDLACSSTDVSPTKPPNSQRSDVIAASQNSSPPADKSKAKKTTANLRRSKIAKWGADHLLTNPKSALATADIRTLLTHPSAWDLLPASDKQELLALMPREFISSPNTPHAQPNTGVLRSNDNFRYDCARYSENIKEGKHDPEWLAQAWVAHSRQIAGDYDEYLVRKFEKDWQETVPEDLLPEKLRNKEGQSEEQENGQNGVSEMTGAPQQFEARLLPMELVWKVPKAAPEDVPQEDVKMANGGPDDQQHASGKANGVAQQATAPEDKA